MSVASTNNNPSRSATTSERTSDARQAFLTAVAETAGPLNAKVQTQYDVIHEQAIQITEQQKQLEKKTQELKRENDEMEKWIGRANKRLEELTADLGGDAGLEDGLEDDLGELEDLLDLIEGEEDQMHDEGGEVETNDGVKGKTGDERV